MLPLARTFTLALLALGSTSCVVHHHHYGEPPTVGAPDARGLAGVVVDADGAPVRARVSAVGATGSSTVGCDERGRFSIPLLPQEPLALVATSEDGRVAVVREVRSGGEPLRVALVEAGARLVIDTQALPGSRLAIRHEGVPVVNCKVRVGETVSIPVPAGSLALVLYRGDRSQRQLVDVEPGAEARVEFRSEAE